MSKSFLASLTGPKLWILILAFFAESLQLCSNECPLKLSFVERILNDTEEVVLIESTGELILKIRGRIFRFEDSSKLFSVRFKDGNLKVDPDLTKFVKLYISIYNYPPASLSKEDVLRIYTTWLQRAEKIYEPLSEESDELRAVIATITEEHNLYVNWEDAKSFSPFSAIFVDGNRLLVANKLLERLLKLNKIEKSYRSLRVILRPILRSVETRRVTNEFSESRLYRFWVFDLDAVRRLARILLNLDWEPKIHKKEEIQPAESEGEKKEAQEIDWDRVNIGW